ncbi:MAG TPA: tetratricopeptide repeat protein [Herpetosiphonaceae bacterium]|nr:tetratricopeptide repeat protein [Herpetosiphonaceae bacterium]
MADDISFGQLVRKHRSMLGLTREELATRVSCSTVTIRKIESGERRPSRPMAQLLADHLVRGRSERAAFLAAAGFSSELPYGHARGQPASPDDRIADRAAHNLPAFLAPLVERDADVAAVSAFLRRPHVRLVTLTGPAGVGKTSLSLAVAWNLVGEVVDSVFFVPLAALRDGSRLLGLIAQTLDLPEAGPAPLLARLAERLHDKEVLLILDNVEQVVSAAPLVVDLLQACPQLKVIVTSRTRLHVRGEHEWPVLPLRLPDLERPPSPEALRHVPAVKLFLERARAVDTTFDLTPQNAPEVAALCVKLDGLPLAIELAAAHIRLLRPGAMLERLQGGTYYEPLRLLDGGPQDMPERHRTLRAAIQWSYDLLAPREQALFARLGVFVGGWTLQAAGCIAAGDAVVPEEDLLPSMRQLLDSSLVRRISGPDVERRFGMLEMVREYALERVDGRGERNLIADRHAAYYCQLAETVCSRFEEVAADAGIQLTLEHDNLRAALQWALDNNQVGLGLRLGAALWPFWNARGHLSEGRRWLERVVAQVDGSTDPQCKLALRPSLAVALNGAGILAWHQADLAAARALLDRSLEVQREIGERAGMSDSLNYLGAVAHHAGDFESACRLYEESLSLRRQIGDKHRIAYSLNNLGLALADASHVAGGRAMLEESLALSRELGHTWMEAYVLDSLGSLALQTGEIAQARQLLTASLCIARPVRDIRLVIPGLEKLARVALDQDCPLDAVRLWAAATALRRAAGVPSPPAWQSEYEASMTRTRAMLPLEAWQAAWDEGSRMTSDEAIAFATTDASA